MHISQQCLVKQCSSLLHSFQAHPVKFPTLKSRRREFIIADVPVTRRGISCLLLFRALEQTRISSQVLTPLIKLAQKSHLTPHIHKHVVNSSVTQEPGCSQLWAEALVPRSADRSLLARLSSGLLSRAWVCYLCLEYFRAHCPVHSALAFFLQSDAMKPCCSRLPPPPSSLQPPRCLGCQAVVNGCLS